MPDVVNGGIRCDLDYPLFSISDIFSQVKMISEEILLKHSLYYKV